MFDSIVFLFVFSVIYIFIIEIFTVLFRLTGLTEEKARFQVISLLTACGFTTSKSEAITMTKKRRHLAGITMLFGYIFSLIIVSVVVNVFMDMSASEVNTFVGIGATFTGVFLLVFGLVKSRNIKKYIDSFIDHICSLLSRRHNNSVIVMDVLANKIIADVQLGFLPDFLAGTPLKNSGLKRKHNIQVLVVSRKGKPLEYVDGDTHLEPHDSVILFGDETAIMDLFGYPLHTERA